jgi:chromate transporter
VAAVFSGLKPAVLGLVAFAVWRIGRRVLRHTALWAIAAAAFLAIFALGIPFPLVILAAVATGLLGARYTPGQFEAAGGHGPAGKDTTASALEELPPPTAGTARTVATWTAVWLAPLVVTALALGPDHVLVREAWFFCKAALVTFGGAYAVLPYVAQQAVETHGWLTAVEMVDGLGLAETTPGPLILVLQYVGFLGAWGQPAPFSPLVAATLGALITTWCTFVPGFLFIFAGAPHMERLREVPLLRRALNAVTAAVVGVVLNLAVWFGWHVLRPSPGVVDWFSVVLAGAALFALARLRWDVVRVVLVCAAAGVAWWLVRTA